MTATPRYLTMGSQITKSVPLPKEAVNNVIDFETVAF